MSEKSISIPAAAIRTLAASRWRMFLVNVFGRQIVVPDHDMGGFADVRLYQGRHYYIGPAGGSRG